MPCSSLPNDAIAFLLAPGTFIIAIEPSGIQFASSFKSGVDTRQALVWFQQVAFVKRGRQWRNQNGVCARTVNGGRSNRIRQFPTPRWGFASTRVCRSFYCGFRATAAVITLWPAAPRKRKGQAARLPPPNRCARLQVYDSSPEGAAGRRVNQRHRLEQVPTGRRCGPAATPWS